MKVKKWHIALISIAVLIIILIAGGVTANLYNTYTYSKSNNYYEADYYDSVNASFGMTNDANAKGAYNYDYDYEYATEENQFVSQQDEQKLIYKGSVALSSENVNRTYSEIISCMNENNGKIEYISENTNYKEITMRIPSDNFIKMYDSLNNVFGEISRSSMEVQDKTKEYTETNKKIEILETEYNELLEMMEKSDDVQDLLAIKDRLVGVTYELEILKSKIETIDYDSNYSLLSIWINNSKYEEPEVDSFTTQFKNSIRASIYGLKLFILFLVRIWWVLILICGILFLIIRKIKKRNKRKSQEIVKESTIDE